MELAYTAQTASQQKSGDSIPCFYVFNRPEGGFVIVAASENIVPILAYSDQGRFETEGVPDNMLGVLRAMQEEIGDAILSRIAAAPKVQTQWENLKQQKAADYNQLADAVEPLTSHLYWDQWPYFNDSCPYDASVSSSNGHRCPAGCTATAMAIVMRYWRYPTHGFGSHSYTHNTYGIQYANFGNTSYNYDNMPEYLPAFPRAFQRQALGQLLYHCGVSVNMNYSPTGSGAYVYAYWNDQANDALHAFQNYFGYSHTQGVRKKDFTDTRWKQLLKTQLRQQQPMIFSGYNPDPDAGSGHAFVCDGFDKNDMFHFNWGWSGKYNCYCTIDSLCPGGVGTGGGHGNYSRNQDGLININPYLEITDLGWEKAYDFCQEEEITGSSQQLLFPDTCMRLCDDGTDGYTLTRLHCLGTTFNPSAQLFGSGHNRKLFQNSYRLDSLRIRYQYQIGNRQPAGARPDTLRIYLSYHEIGDSSYQMVSLLQSDSPYLCPLTENHPVRPIASNRICIDYPLSSADTAHSQMIIPINYQKSTALGFDIPENAIMSVMLQFIPGYPYQDGDTLRITTDGNPQYLHNAFALTCLQSKYSTFSNGQYNAALWENSGDSSSLAYGYTPIRNSFPQWDYFLHYNTRPTAAYLEKDTQICGIPFIWDRLHISQDGDYRQIFITPKGDSIVTLHLSLDNGIANMGAIHGVTAIDSLGYYDFHIEPVENATYYRWELSSPLWQLQSDSLQSKLAVTGRSSGTLKATAFSHRGICSSSNQIHLAFCDSMGTVSEIQGLDQISHDGVYFYYIDSVEKATSYRWSVFHEGWSIQGDSNRTSTMVRISQSGADSLYLTVTDECGYTTTRTLLIQSSVNIAENDDKGTAVLIGPNPAQEQVTIRLTQQESFEAILTDAHGRFLQRQKAEGECTFNMQPYAAGIYIITIRGKNSFHRYPLVKTCSAK